MKLNHVAITVTDVYEARRFLEGYFGMEGIGKNNDTMTHVQDDEGVILSIFGGDSPTPPEKTHIGFIQETEAQVDEIYERLKADGFDVSPPERSHGWTFHFVAPGGFAVEVVC